MGTSLKWFFFSVLLILSSCKNPHKVGKDTYAVTHIESGKTFVDTLNVLAKELSLLDMEANSSQDSIIRLNEQIRDIIESVSSNSLLSDINDAYKSTKQDFEFVLSSDNKLAVFTWNTNMASSISSYRNIALYVKGSKVVPTSLYSNATIYNQIYTINSKRGEPIYLLHGWDRPKNAESYARLDAYSIKPNGIELEKVFPNRKESLLLVHKKKDSLPNSSLKFKIQEEGTLINIPQLLDSTIAHRIIEFDGMRFDYASLKD